MPIKESKQDAGYAWIVLLVSFINNMISSVVFISPSVYMMDWMEAFVTTKVKVTAIGSIHSVTASVLGTVRDNLML